MFPSTISGSQQERLKRLSKMLLLWQWKIIKQSNKLEFRGGIDMVRSIRDSLSGFGSELLERIRENSNARLDEAAFEERVIGIEKAIAALQEAEVEDEKIIYLLQKYWDLRLSEAKELLRQERYTKEK